MPKTFSPRRAFPQFSQCIHISPVYLNSIDRPAPCLPRQPRQPTGALRVPAPIKAARTGPYPRPRCRKHRPVLVPCVRGDYRPAPSRRSRPSQLFAPCARAVGNIDRPSSRASVEIPGPRPATGTPISVFVRAAPVSAGTTGPHRASTEATVPHRAYQQTPREPAHTCTNPPEPPIPAFFAPRAPAEVPAPHRAHKQTPREPSTPAHPPEPPARAALHAPRPPIPSTPAYLRVSRAQALPAPAKRAEPDFSPAFPLEKRRRNHV